MTSFERLFWVHIGIATDGEAAARKPKSRPDSSPYWELELVSGRRPNGSGYRQSADVRDIADVNAWLAPLPFQGMVFEH